MPFRAGTLLAFRTTVVFVLFYCYLWLVVNPAVYHHFIAPAFLLDWTFFQETVTRPGDVTEYIAVFLLQFFYYAWVGALIFTLLAWLVCLATKAVFTHLRGARCETWHLFPAILLLALLSRYDYPAVHAGVGMLVAVAFVIFYVRIPASSAPARTVVFLAMSILVYWVTGGWYLLFGLLCGIVDASGGRRASCLVCLAVTPLVPYLIGIVLLHLGPMSAYTRWLSFKARAFSVPLYGFLPVVGVGLVLWRWWQGHRARKAAGPRKPASRWSLVEAYTTSRFKWLLHTAALLIAAAILLSWSFRRDRKATIAIDYYACHKMWDRVLQEARQFPSRNEAAIANVNRALYHTGRLPSEMFSFPQIKGLSLLYPRDTQFGSCLRMSDLCFDLGCVNYAEKWACEALEVGGDHPIVLQRLARINVLKGRTEAARTFLNRLRKNPVHRRWASRRLAELETDPNLSQDDELAYIRARMFTRDHCSTYLPTEPMLTLLLKVNRYNRMAFEYLMAHYLLNKEYDKIAENLSHLGDFGYPEIPVHYEEALVLYGLSTGQTDLRKQGWPIREITYQRIRSYAALLKRCQSDVHAAASALVGDFGDTYWFYDTFGESGVLAFRTSTGTRR